MWRYVILLSFVSALAISWAGFFAENEGTVRDIAQSTRERIDPNTQRTDQPAQPVPLSGIERLRADPRGHHIAFFRLNGLCVEGMIDTGATAVAINASTARRAGIQLSPGDFIYTVETANGTVRAARATLDEVSLGSIRVHDVETLVLEDQALGMVLIGMSFMGKLRSFKHENGLLVLRR